MVSRMGCIAGSCPLFFSVPDMLSQLPSSHVCCPGTEQKGGNKSKGAAKSEVLTGNAITPGTSFMLDITLSLTAFVCSKLATRKYQHLRFEISDGTVQVTALGRERDAGELEASGLPSNL